MAQATRELLLHEARDAFLSMRVLSGGYQSAIDVVAMSIEESWPRLRSSSAERLARFFRRRLIQSTKIVREMSLYFPAELTACLKKPIEAVANAASERRVVLLGWWAKLPADDRELIEAHYCQEDAGKVQSHLAYFTRAHLELLHLLDLESPVAGTLKCETDENDLARLILKRESGDFPDESRSVLETLLIGEQGNQQFYTRLMACVAELEWLLGTKPDWESMELPAPPSLREKIVTWAFLSGCLAALGSVIYAIRSWLVG